MRLISQFLAVVAVAAQLSPAIAFKEGKPLPLIRDGSFLYDSINPASVKYTDQCKGLKRQNITLAEEQEEGASVFLNCASGNFWKVRIEAECAFIDSAMEHSDSLIREMQAIARKRNGEKRYPLAMDIETQTRLMADNSLREDIDRQKKDYAYLAGLSLKKNCPI